MFLNLEKNFQTKIIIFLKEKEEKKSSNLDLESWPKLFFVPKPRS
jgi:hypothetical protein